MPTPDTLITKAEQKDRMGISLPEYANDPSKVPLKVNSFVLGSRCHQYLDLHQNYDKISPVTLCAAFWAILKSGNFVLFKGEREYTVTQPEKIFQSRQTINRHVLGF